MGKWKGAREEVRRGREGEGERYMYIKLSIA